MAEIAKPEGKQQHEEQNTAQFAMHKDLPLKTSINSTFKILLAYRSIAEIAKSATNGNAEENVS